MSQLDLHKKIEQFFKAGTQSASIEAARELLLNDDAKRFFFSLADKTWFEWFVEKDFFIELNNNKEDSAYRASELEYLARIAEAKPVEVASVIYSIKISEADSNPSILGGFLWIIQSLPAEQIKTLTAKIRDEKWFYLTRNFRKTGYEFEKIITKLVDKKESNAILELAEAMLLVKSKTEITEKHDSFSMEDPFYITDIDTSGIFEAMAGIEVSYIQRALEVTIKVMAQIITMGTQDEEKVFDYEDSYALYDVDFFTLEITNGNSYSYRDDIKNLAATLKKLIERVLEPTNTEPAQAKQLFAKYIHILPDSRSMWRLKLFALAQSPQTFSKELKAAFFRIFDVGERYFEISGGAEYHQALIRGFEILDPAKEQREYVAKVFEYFGAELNDEDKEIWRKRDGGRILAVIKSHLTEEEKKLIPEKLGIPLEKLEYIPEPSIGQIRSGTVHHIAPEPIDNLTIDQIITKLKTDWTKEKLSEQYENDDFLKPRGVEGLGDALKEDIKKRTDEYLETINSFFDRSCIHSHYLWSLLRGIDEIIRGGQSFNAKQTAQILGLFEAIRVEGIKTPYKRKDDKSWLADWIEVLKQVGDILIYILEDKDKAKRVETHKTYREQAKDLISYLLTIQESPSRKDEKQELEEPYHVAINSVRGRAFEIFYVFVGNDGEKLADDVKEIYKEVLNDDSLAVRFVIGRYLTLFYFRDKEFITELLPEIFPKDNPNKKDAYLASWEGYLSNTLYDKMFTALQAYYQHAITLDQKNYTKRKYSKGLDESLSIHIALAFVHLGLKMDDPLFVQFWSVPSIIRHKEFISFIGQTALRRDYTSNEDKLDKEKLLSFWDWALDSKEVESEALSGFDFWINPEQQTLDDSLVVKKVARTVEKTDGDIDWEYGLLHRLPIFASKDEESTLAIISNYLLDSKGELNKNRHRPLLYDNEMKEALTLIYKKGSPEIKEKVKDLISRLIEKGSSIFWGLKDVLNSDLKSN